MSKLHLANVAAWHKIMEMDQLRYLDYLDESTPVCGNCGCFEVEPGDCYDCNPPAKTAQTQGESTCE